MSLDTEVSDFALKQNCYNFRMVERIIAYYSYSLTVKQRKLVLCNKERAYDCINSNVTPGER